MITVFLITFFGGLLVLGLSWHFFVHLYIKKQMDERAKRLKFYSIVLRERGTLKNYHMTILAEDEVTARTKAMKTMNCPCEVISCDEVRR